jgi:xylose isomerase
VVAVKTSLGIWALSTMVTRFVPGGYQPQWAGEDTPGRVRRAVEGLGELIDGYEFHYPQELNEQNVEAIREALGPDHDIYCLAGGLHLDPRFGRGGLCNPDPSVRDEAVKVAVAGAKLSGELAVPMIVWPGIEGYNYPFQTPYAQSWDLFIDGLGQVAGTLAEKGQPLWLEHKNSEPAMKILMRNIGMTLFVIHELRDRGHTNVKVNMDWQHLIMNGESLAEYAALLSSRGLLGHQHANSGWGTFDDDNMVGATAFMETLELALEFRRNGYGSNGERLGFDLYPYTEDAVAAVRRSVLQWRFIDGVAAKIDDGALREAQAAKDAVRAYEIVYAALGA